MSSLRDLQKKFVLCLNSEKKEILDLIDPSSKLSSADHFAIYRGSVIGSQQKAIKEIYPVVYKLVGDEFFYSMVNEYIRFSPSYSADLSDYGADFPKFLSHFTPVKSLLYLSDVAKLEWAWHRVFSAPKNKKMNFKKLAYYSEQQSEKLIFLLPKGSFLLSSFFPIHLIWETNQDSYNGPREIVLQEGCYYYFIWRNELDMRIEQIDLSIWQTLTWMREEFTIAEIAEKISAHFPQTDIVMLLPELVKKGWLNDFKLKK